MNIKALAIIVALLLPSIVFASAENKVRTSKIKKKTEIVKFTPWFIDAGLGYSFNKVKESLSDYNVGHSNIKSRTENNYLVNLGIGRKINDRISISLDFNYLPKTTHTVVSELVPPDSVIHYYTDRPSFDIKAGFVNLEYNFGNYTEYNIEPFLIGGVGLSYNTINYTKEINFSGQDSNENDVDVRDIIQYRKPFKSINFAYQIGFGISSKVSDRVGIYVKFIHKNFGNVKVRGYPMSYQIFQNGVLVGTPDGQAGDAGQGKLTMRSNGLIFGTRIKL